MCYVSRQIMPITVSEDGLLKGAQDVFKGVKKAADYHSEMNGLHFEEHLR